MNITKIWNNIVTIFIEFNTHKIYFLTLILIYTHMSAKYKYKYILQRQLLEELLVLNFAHVAFYPNQQLLPYVQKFWDFSPVNKQVRCVVWTPLFSKVLPMLHHSGNRSVNIVDEPIIFRIINLDYLFQTCFFFQTTSTFLLSFLFLSIRTSTYTCSFITWKFNFYLPPSFQH